MTTEEAKQKKKELETNIWRLIESFADETGYQVRGINIRTMETAPVYGGGTSRVVIGVELAAGGVMLTCERCKFQNFKATDGDVEGHPHPCPHAYWDDEYGCWREASDYRGEGWPPACFAFELDLDSLQPNH